MENSTQKSLEILATAVKKADIHVLELVSKLLQVIIYIKNNDDQLSRVLFRSEESDKLHRFNGIIFDSRGEIICYPIKRMINTALCDANKIQEYLREIAERKFLLQKDHLRFSGANRTSTGTASSLLQKQPQR